MRCDVCNTCPFPFCFVSSYPLPFLSFPLLLLRLFLCVVHAHVPIPLAVPVPVPVPRCSRTAYYIGKPNPIIMRAALAKLGTAPMETCIIGDRLDTDILAGIQTELRTCLLLTGVTSLPDVALCAYRPDVILPSLGHILTDGHEQTEQVSSHTSRTQAGASNRNTASTEAFTRSAVSTADHLGGQLLHSHCISYVLLMFSSPCHVV